MSFLPFAACPSPFTVFPRLSCVFVSRLLESFLEEIGVTQEQFAAECDRAMAKGGDSAFVYHQIMAVEDFVSFKRVRRIQPPVCNGEPL